MKDKELEKEVEELSNLFTEAFAQALTKRGKKTGIASISLALVNFENKLYAH
ncbi:hypothetical protein [Hallella sp.]|uniref:hypothetical protein n=1 Tax=Hallella sp. TaxID=2980186 RepID=UPI00307A15C5